MHIKNHPILGQDKKRKLVKISIDGKTLKVLKDIPIAAALLQAGIKVFRYTKKRKEPRGIFCAIGRCNDCVMTIDGIPNVRTCVTLLKEGMIIETQNRNRPD